MKHADEIRDKYGLHSAKTGVNETADELLKRLRGRNTARNGDFKRIVTQYFEVADDYRQRTGKTPAPVIIAIRPRNF